MAFNDPKLLDGELRQLEAEARGTTASDAGRRRGESLARRIARGLRNTVKHHETE